MRKSGLIILVFVLLVSCTKTNPISLEDSILYTIPNPAIELSSVLSYGVEDLTVCKVDIPVPGDSTASISFDVSGEGENDFIIDVSHNPWDETDECGPCRVFEYQVTITGTGGNNYISFNSIYSWEPEWYSLNDTIMPNSSWNTVVFLKMQGGCDRRLIDLGDKYIGIKHNNDYGWIRVAPLPNNGIEIKEFALNQTDNKSIVAGQKN